MRVDVAVEGRWTRDRLRFIEIGALIFPEAPVPVTYDGFVTFVGRAGDFQRDDRGVISCEVELVEFVIPDNASMHIAVRDVIWQPLRGYRMESGYIYGLFITDQLSAWRELDKNITWEG